MTRKEVPLDLEIIASNQAFAALKVEWLVLCDSLPSTSVFSSWEWQFNWWDVYCKNTGELHLFVVRDAGRLVAILPTWIETLWIGGVLPVRRLRLIGTGGDTSPDDLSLIAAEGYDASSAGAVVRSVFHCSSKWDMVLLTDLLPGAVLEGALTAEAQRRGHVVVSSTCSDISFTELPGTWNEYPGGMSGSARYRIQRRQRCLVKEFDARFFVWTDADWLDEVFDRLVVLHRRRWQGQPDHYAFQSPAYLEFHRRVIRDFMRLDRVRLYCLEVQGKIIAINYCYRYKNWVYYFQSGFDPAFSDAMPGHAVMGFAIRHAIEEGNVGFDMLKGQYRFKAEWAKEHRETRQIELYRRTLPAWAYRVRHEQQPQLKRQIKQLVLGPMEASRSPGVACSPTLELGR